MTETLDLGLEDLSADSGDNVTDWCLERFQARYGPQVTKDDIWEYLYGVMARLRLARQVQARLAAEPAEGAVRAGLRGVPSGGDAS